MTTMLNPHLTKLVLRMPRLINTTLLRYKSTAEYNKPSNAVRIGCASGFWGDTTVAASQLVNQGKIDFLVFDYLSEITMSLLTAVKNKAPNMGYAPDFIQVSMASCLSQCKDKNIRVISNAGGVNPHACAEALQQLAKHQNIALNIAVVTGDDVMPQLDTLRSSDVREMTNNMPLPKSVTSMNAYLGAGPIVKALDLGADIVITGRCVDSALVLAPLVHKFGWDVSDFDLLAAGSLAGHLVECGAQVTGGIFTDWHKVNGWDRIGFPIVECDPSGKFLVTKPPKTGGLISSGTVSEQLLYEIGDPKNYLLPDVSCDFSDVSLQECSVGNEVGVLVDGVRGKAPPPQYKVSATYADGYRITAVCCVAGPRSHEKAAKTVDAILSRCRYIFKALGLEDFSNTHVELVGQEERYGAYAKPYLARETMLWLGVQHRDKKALEILSREIAPAGTGMAPGLTGLVGGRPNVSPVLKLFSFLHDKDQMKVDIFMNGDRVDTYTPPASSSPVMSSPPLREDKPVPKPNLLLGSEIYRLEDLAFTRSGDKGDSANIGVIARKPEYLPYIQAALTQEAVYEYFQHLFPAGSSPECNVQRYEVPGIHALNFVLTNSLGGGGVASLRSDPQGKAFGQMLLDFEIPNVPEAIKKRVVFR